MPPRKRRAVATSKAKPAPLHGVHRKPRDGPILPMEILLIIASFLVPRPLPIRFNHTPYNPMDEYLYCYVYTAYWPSWRFEVLHKLSQVSRSFRATYLSMMATHLEVFDMHSLNRYGREMWPGQLDEKEELEIVLLDMLDFYILKHPFMASLVRNVTVGLVENHASKVYPHFIRSLTRFPNLEELHLVNIPEGYVQLLKQALQGHRFPSIHTLAIQEENLLEEEDILEPFPNLRALTIIGTRRCDPEVLNEIETHCPLLEYLDGHDIIDIIQLLVPDKVPNLKVLASRIVLDPDEGFEGIGDFDDRVADVRCLSSFRQLKEVRFVENHEGDMKGTLSQALLSTAKDVLKASSSPEERCIKIRHRHEEMNPYEEVIRVT